MTNPKLYLYPWVLDSMPEYSLTLPTGTTIGKVWRSRFKKSGWIVGMYVEAPDPNMVGILWFGVELLSGPAPRSYFPPDWSNYEQWLKERRSNAVHAAT